MYDPKYPFGIVSSIYFDTPSKAAFAEKENGDLLKTKIRLRWYKETITDETAETLCFLEVKNRIGSGRTKERGKLYAPAKWINEVPLESHEIAEFMIEKAPDFEPLFRRNVLPMMTVVYKRHRFICPVTGARVCLDTHIHSDRVNSHYMPSAWPQEVDTIVFEIKDVPPQDVPWVEEMYLHGFRETSFSKYYECMVKSLNEGVNCE